MGGALNRNWIDRLLPVTPGGSDAVFSEAIENPTEAGGVGENLDPCTASGLRLQDMWLRMADEVVERGRGLIGVNNLADGVEGLIAELYLIAARQWPRFIYVDDEHTVRWLVAILRHLVCQSVRQQSALRAARHRVTSGHSPAKSVRN